MAKDKQFEETYKLVGLQRFERVSHRLSQMVEVERLLGKVVSDANRPEYTIQVDERGNRSMSRIFPLWDWMKENLK